MIALEVSEFDTKFVSQSLHQKLVESFIFLYDSNPNQPNQSTPKTGTHKVGGKTSTNLPPSAQPSVKPQVGGSHLGAGAAVVAQIRVALRGTFLWSHGS